MPQWKLLFYMFEALLFFFWLYLWHVEIPGPGIEPVPQQWPRPQQQQCHILRWLLWLRFSPWPGTFHMLWVWPKIFFLFVFISAIYCVVSQSVFFCLFVLKFTMLRIFRASWTFGLLSFINFWNFSVIIQLLLLFHSLLPFWNFNFKCVLYLYLLVFLFCFSNFSIFGLHLTYFILTYFPHFACVSVNSSIKFLVSVV